MQKFDQLVNEELRQAISGTKYAEKVNPYDYYLNPSDKRIKRFTIEGDDAQHTKKWQALMKDCAHYYDKPRFDQEFKMKKDL